MTVPLAAEGGGVGRRSGTAYGVYALIVLLCINILNYADRSILSILAEPIKQDLGVSDAQLAFLYGASFVVLNSIAGLALAPVVDMWLRNRLLMLGVGIWSLLTGLSGLATNFAGLAAARLGVGIGEAVGAPVSHSLMADMFAAHRRTTIFAVFFCGPLVGSSLAVYVGGFVVQNWPAYCGALDACAIRGWQAAFFVFGIPGLFFAILAGGLRDPSSRAVAAARRSGAPISVLMRQLAVLVPPLPLFVLARRAGAKAARTNLLIAAIAVAGAAGLIALTGDYGQWIAVAVVFYAILSWCQSLAAREPDVYRLTAGSPAMLCLILGTATVAICNGAVGFWAAPLAIRSLGLDPGSAGTLLGLALGIGPFAGIFLAGIVADRWRQTNIAAPVWVILAGMIQCAAMIGLMLTASDPMIYAIAVAGVMLGSSAWFPVIAAAVQDLVTPSMRGRAAAFYSVVLNSFGMSAGAYSAGKVADLTGSLKIGLLVPFATLPIGVLLLVVCVGLLPSAHRKRDEIAARNGETASAAAH